MGVLGLTAVLLGAALAGLLIGVRKRRGVRAAGIGGGGSATRLGLGSAGR